MVLNASSDAKQSEPVFLNSLKQKRHLQGSCSWVSWETEILHSKCEAHGRLSAFLRGKASTEPLWHVAYTYMIVECILWDTRAA